MEQLHAKMVNKTILLTLAFFIMIYPLFSTMVHATYGGYKKIPVTSVSLNPDSLELDVGENARITASIKPANASNKNVIWASTNPKVATVSNGIVSAIGQGKALIKVTTEDGKYSDTASVTVTNPVIAVKGIELSPKLVEMFIGDPDKQLTAIIKPANASNQKVTWTSSNPKVATVSNGRVHSVSKGKVTITVKTEDGKYCDTATIKVSDSSIAVKSIELTPKLVTMNVGSPDETLNAKVKPTNATNQEVTWVSFNPYVATVDNGIVHAVRPGIALIKVFTQDGLHHDWSLITVCLPKTIKVKGIEVTPKLLTLTVGGETGQLTAAITPENATNQKITWGSSNSKIATVDKNGIVTPVSPGTVTITATTADGKYKDTATVTVTEKVIPTEGLTVTPKNLNLIVGDADGTLTATVLPANATNKDVTWTSSDPSIATVENGLVHPISPGTVIITATTADGNYTDTATVTVTNPIIPVISLTLTPKVLNLFVGGDSGTLFATVLPENASNQNLTWISSDPTVVTVVNGVVQPVGVGTAIITVSTEGGLTAMADVNVTDPDTVPPVTKVSFTPIFDKDNKYVESLVTLLTATDDKSGVKETLYQVNGAGWRIYTGPFTVHAKTDYLLEFYSKDNAGNIEKINVYDFDKGTCSCSK